MSRRLFFFITCLILLTAQIAPAQTINESNVLAFYFDEEATERSWYGTGDVTAYLIAGPMIQPGLGNQPYEYLQAWSCDIDVSPVENYSGALLTMRGLAIPATIELTGSWAMVDVLLPEPLALSGRTVVAELTLNVSSTERTELRVWGINFTADDVEDQFEILTSGSDGPMDMTNHTANINDDAPVSDRETSWSNVKALYR